MFTLKLLNNFRFWYQTNSNSRGLNSSYKLAVKACSKFVLESMHQLEHFSSIWHLFQHQKMYFEIYSSRKTFYSRKYVYLSYFSVLGRYLNKKFSRTKTSQFQGVPNHFKKQCFCVYVCMCGWVCGSVLVPLVLFMLQFSAERNGKWHIRKILQGRIALTHLENDFWMWKL